MKSPKLILLFLALVLVMVPLIACSSKSTITLPTTSLPGATTSAEVNEWSSPPAMKIDTSKQYTAIISTNLGDIQVQLFPTEDPKTVNNLFFSRIRDFIMGVSFSVS